MTGNAVKRIGLIPAHAGKTSAASRVCIVMGAHPRSRGENPDRSSRLRYERGSSPLTRGKPIPVRRIDTRERLIPAHAGKTARVPRGAKTCAAHPRSRGENVLILVWGLEVGGSSPLTRGKLGAEARVGAELRLIPAHAGKTTGPPASTWTRSAHPRSRGENAS